jgi:two-component system, OmpR family, phosphate regulon sensor histidine kinase PhoR
LIAEYQTRRIVKPINALDLENPAEREVYDELSPLLIRIHHQRKHIESQMKELERKKDQFDEITKNMAEGLVVLDARGMVYRLIKARFNSLGSKNQIIPAGIFRF